MLGPMGLIREGSRQFLMHAAKYDITITGVMPKSTPDDRYLVAMYPHGEHANSILLPLSYRLSYLAARDHFYGNPVNYIMALLTASTIPLARKDGEKTKSAQQHTYDRMERAFHSSQKVGIYPQGTRVGPIDDVAMLRGTFMRNKGTAKFSHKFQAPVIPVGFVYPPEFQPKKGGDTGEKRLLRRLTGKHLEPVSVEVKIGQPIPAVEHLDDVGDYMAGLATLLWSMVHCPPSEN